MIERIEGVTYFRFKYVAPDGRAYWCFEKKPLEALRKKLEAGHKMEGQ